VRYVLIEEKAGAATRVDVEVGYALTGALAQFSRSGIVNDLAERLTTAFARNLEVRLDGSVDASQAPQHAELDAGSLVLAVVRARIKRFFIRLLGRWPVRSRFSPANPARRPAGARGRSSAAEIGLQHTSRRGGRRKR
jgi:hypothetical protein